MYFPRYHTFWIDIEMLSQADLDFQTSSLLLRVTHGPYIKKAIHVKQFDIAISKIYRRKYVTEN